MRSVRSPARDTARRHSRHLFGFPQLDEACKGAMAHPIGPFEFLDPHNSLKNGLSLPTLWGEFPFMGSLRVPCFLFRNQKEQRNPFWRGPVLKKEDTALPLHGHIGYRFGSSACACQGLLVRALLQIYSCTQVSAISVSVISFLQCLKPNEP